MRAVCRLIPEWIAEKIIDGRRVQIDGTGSFTLMLRRKINTPPHRAHYRLQPDRAILKFRMSDVFARKLQPHQDKLTPLVLSSPYKKCNYELSEKEKLRRAKLADDLRKPRDVPPGQPNNDHEPEGLRGQEIVDANRPEDHQRHTLQGDEPGGGAVRTGVS